MKRVSGFTVVELLVLLAIILIIARWIIVFTYGPRISAWERSVVESWGLPYVTLQIFGTATFLLVLVVVAIRRRLKQRRNSRLEVPR
jgi:hypothetical protein